MTRKTQEKAKQKAPLHLRSFLLLLCARGPTSPGRECRSHAVQVCAARWWVCAEPRAASYRYGTTVRRNWLEILLTLVLSSALYKPSARYWDSADSGMFKLWFCCFFAALFSKRRSRAMMRSIFFFVLIQKVREPIFVSDVVGTY